MEHALLSRLMQPLRATLTTGGAPAGADRLAEFLSGNQAFLMLGDLVRSYTEASKLLAHATKPASAAGLLASWIERLPNPAALHPIPGDRASERRRALHAISDARIPAAHAVSEGAHAPPDAAPHWQKLVTDPQDAFFRYFAALFAGR